MIVLRRMLFAFGGARVTGRRARVAHLGGERSSTGHHPHGCGAGICTITIEPDAHHHRSNIALVQAGVGAHFTRHEALHARFHTDVVRRSSSSQVLPKFDRSHRILRHR